MKQNKIRIEISFFRYWDKQDKRSREKVLIPVEREYMNGCDNDEKCM